MIGSLIKPNYPKAAIGLEQENLTAVALEREGKNRYAVKQAATIALPDNLISPNFLEKNVSNANELMVLINETLVNAGLQNQKRWSVSLPSATARTAILTLESEPTSKPELAEILEWKAERSFGAPASELRISQQKISPDAAGKPRYFSTAVKLSILDEYETIFETLGWQAGLIMPRPVSEANWLVDAENRGDALLISSQSNGFTAVLLRGNEPTVVRTVTCDETEVDDEVYRLLMFYRDRLGIEASGSLLEKLLVIGESFSLKRLHEISTEALGAALTILRPEDVGLNIPASSLKFDDLAAPAGLAALAWS